MNPIGKADSRRPEDDFFHVPAKVIIQCGSVTQRLFVRLCQRDALRQQAPGPR